MKTKFDEIFVIHLADNKERMLNIDEQFLKLEIKPTIYYTTKRPFSNKIANVFRPQIETDYYNKKSIENNDVYGNVFNCTLAHYDIIKTSYERGLERILICEDDICFCDDLNLIHKYFNVFPEDYDIIKYHSSYFRYSNIKTVGFVKYLNDTSGLQYNGSGDIYSTLCYSLNRSGMKYYIDFIDNCFVAADIPFCIFDKNVKDVIFKNNIKYPNIFNINNKICWPIQKYDSSIV